MMRKGIFTGLASVFTPMMLLLAGCGSGQIVLPNSLNTPSPFSQTNGLNASGGTASPSTSVVKSNDPLLENYAQAIQSPSYAGNVMLTVESSDGLSLVNGRLAGSTSSARAVAATINRVLDDAGAGIKITGVFGKNIKLMKNRRRQLEIVSGKRIKDISTYFKIAVSDKAKAENILRGLWKKTGLRVTYPSMKGKPAGLETVPDLSGGQGYLKPLEQAGGLNIEVVWARGIRGEGVQVWDVEGVWNPQHENFPPSLHGEITGSGSLWEKAHGTAVMGILASLHGERGIRGIIPSADVKMAKTSDPHLTVDGLFKYFDDLEPGDIYFFEMVVPGGRLMECNPEPGVGVDEACVAPEASADKFASIQYALAEGLTIVEAAGNSGVDLGDPRVQWGEGHPNMAVDDSGAIMVGASMGRSREKASWSNCGNRVNLFAWGSGVVTTSYPGARLDWYGNRPQDLVNDPNQPNLYYTDSFGGTSASEPMIAGAAALLQSYAKQQMGGKKFLTPEKVREILVASGVPAVGDEDCRIGKQPRMDVALQLFDEYWAQAQRDFPELGGADEIRGDRRRALRQRGVGLICKMYDPENSDPQCPEVAKCVLDRSIAQVRYERDSDTRNYTYNLYDANGFTIESDCRSTRCLPIDVNRSDYDCMAGAIWPTGLRLAKTLDFDSDQKADLVNWTETKWQIVLSSAHPEIVAGDASALSRWDIDLAVPRIAARWVWPVVEDYNSDGRADLAAYDKEHGVWYVKFTDSRLLSGDWGSGWDWQIQLPYRDVLDRKPRLTQYARPVPGDYNGDGYIDLALARSDGLWSIDFGGPNLSDYGSFDRDITYLASEQLAQAPGWAYLPIPGKLLHEEGKDDISFKIPDGIANAGEVIHFTNLDPAETINLNDYVSAQPFGGNESIPFSIDGLHVGLKRSSGDWPIAVYDEFILTSVAPDHIYGGLDCHPFVGDFDGDGFDDRAVQCPQEFRIAFGRSNQNHTIPLPYNPAEFSLPGKPYFGSVSYATTQRLLEWMLNASPAAPVIPVDMVSGSICRLPLGRNMPQECR